MRHALPARPLLGSRPVQRALKRVIQRQPPGPSDEQRASGSSLLWGEVLDAAGQRRVSRLRTPEGYTLTVLTALAIVEKVLAGAGQAGLSDALAGLRTRLDHGDRGGDARGFASNPVGSPVNATPALESQVQVFTV